MLANTKVRTFAEYKAACSRIDSELRQIIAKRGWPEDGPEDAKDYKSFTKLRDKAQQDKAALLDRPTPNDRESNRAKIGGVLVAGQALRDAINSLRLNVLALHVMDRIDTENDEERIRNWFLGDGDAQRAIDRYLAIKRNGQGVEERGRLLTQNASLLRAADDAVPSFGDAFVRLGLNVPFVAEDLLRLEEFLVNVHANRVSIGECHSIDVYNELTSYGGTVSEWLAWWLPVLVGDGSLYLSSVPRRAVDGNPKGQAVAHAQAGSPLIGVDFCELANDLDDAASLIEAICEGSRNAYTRMKLLELQRRLAAQLNHGDVAVLKCDANCRDGLGATWEAVECLQRIASSNDYDPDLARRIASSLRGDAAWLRPEVDSAQAAGASLASSQTPSARFTHSLDFRSVLWDGTTYSFTANQAAVVKLLWSNWKAGTPDVGDESLLMAVDPEAPPMRLNVLFRDSPAWGSMIVSGGTRGTHRLAGKYDE